MTDRLRESLVRQFGCPHGPLGTVAGWIMSARDSNRKRNRWTVDLLGIRPYDRVLEIGFGPGLALRDCCERAVSGRVVGLDHSPVMLSQAARRNRRAVGSGQLRLICGGLDKLGDAGGPFDKIFSVNLIQFLKDKVQAFKGLHAALAPGGVIATTYMPRMKGQPRANAARTAEGIVAAMTAAGFGEVRVEELELRPHYAICALATKG